MDRYRDLGVHDADDRNSTERLMQVIRDCPAPLQVLRSGEMEAKDYRLPA